MFNVRINLNILHLFASIALSILNLLENGS